MIERKRGVNPPGWHPYTSQAASDQPARDTTSTMNVWGLIDTATAPPLTFHDHYSRSINNNIHLWQDC